jgi:hypothetical protein
MRRSEPKRSNNQPQDAIERTVAIIEKALRQIGQSEKGIGPHLYLMLTPNNSEDTGGDFRWSGNE